MRKTKALVLSLLLAGALPSAGRADDARQTADASVAQWNAALAKGKVEDIVSLYADGAMLVRPNGTVSKSADEIRNFWRNLFDKKGGTLALDIVEVSSDREDTVVAKTTLTDIKTLRDTSQAMKYSYEGVLYSVFKRQGDGTWKAQVQRWSDKNNI